MPMDIENLIRKIESWLLDSRIQVKEGKDKGGVLGWLDDVHEEFIYMEITGYYLTFLSFLLSKPTIRNKEKILTNARDSLHWLDQLSKRELGLLTRKYINPNIQDWRNAVVFSFDVAMVIRGIVNITKHLPHDNGNRVLERYLIHLVRQCNGNVISPYYTLDTNVSVPERWSTVPNIHQVKIAAALSFIQNHKSKHLHSLILTTCLRWSEYLSDRGLRDLELHPVCYYIEGIITLYLNGYADQICIAEAVSLYCDIMSLQRHDGTLPAKNMITDDGPCTVQSDVMAQALRIGSILKILGFLKGDEWTQRLSLLVVSISRFVNNDGGVYYYQADVGCVKYLNSWATFFSYQAFYLYKEMSEDRKTDVNLLRLLV